VNLGARLILLAIDFSLLSAPPFLQRWIGGDVRAYVVTTLLVVAVNVALLRLWAPTPIHHKGNEGHKGRYPNNLVLGVLCVLCVVGVLFTTTGRWLHEILATPNDPQLADMLVVVQQGIQRAFHRQNPYTIYHLPWDAPLPYGPALWLPFAVPFALHADIRFVTIAGMLFAPVACALAAFMSVRRSEWMHATGWLAVLVALCTNPDLQRFAVIGHTPAYWPLLALFVWLTASRRWPAAAVAACLLIVARTTMVAVVPVFLMMVWHDARPRFARTSALLVAAAIVPFLPFAIWDFGALRYALYDSYQITMKGFVWASTTWVQHTIGITGWLLAAGWSRAVEVVQAVVMLAVYAAAWRAIRSSRTSMLGLPWMGFALLAFSMTTLWPVTYIYFDVALLFICAALDETAWVHRSPARAAAVALAAAIAMIIAVAVVQIPRAETSRYRKPDHEEVLIPRLGRGDAVVEIDVITDMPGQMTALLNGAPLGTVTLTAGSQHVSLAAPARLWQVGVNELEPSFSGGVARTSVGRVTVK
jgi:hypothetical protein